MYVVFVYDISLETKAGQRVLRNVFKISKKYLHHIQNSVFEGEVTKAQLEKLRSEVSRYIRKEQDSIIVFKSRTEKWLEKEFWGVCVDKTSNLI